jgi:hypothetical protein
MLKLDLTQSARWLDVAPGVRLHLRPLTTALMVATRNDPDVVALSQDASDEDRALVFAKALGAHAILAWEGVGNAQGEAIGVSPEGVHALLDVWPIFEAFQTAYVAKALVLDQEKNV